jgi:hypothetical protein
MRPSSLERCILRWRRLRFLEPQPPSRALPSQDRLTVLLDLLHTTVSASAAFVHLCQQRNSCNIVYCVVECSVCPQPILTLGIVCRLQHLSAAQVPLQRGRPDLVAAINDMASMRGDKACMGVWSAGPKAMNSIVYEATGRLCGDVRLFPLAYEM